jgi:hypothetical protein
MQPLKRQGDIQMVVCFERIEKLMKKAISGRKG